MAKKETRTVVKSFKDGSKKWSDGTYTVPVNLDGEVLNFVRDVAKSSFVTVEQAVQVMLVLAFKDGSLERYADSLSKSKKKKK